MEEMINIVSKNPALGLAAVLLVFALILSILKKLVKVAALTLIVIGGLVYILQNQGIENATKSLNNVSSTVKDTQDAVEALSDNLPDADSSTIVEVLEEPAKTVEKVLQNTATSAAETGKKLPTSLKDILPKSMQPSANNDSTDDASEEQTTAEKKQELKNKMRNMVKKRTNDLKERIKRATESARGN